MLRYLILGFLFLPSLFAPCEGQQDDKKLGGVCFSSFRDNESPARQLHPLPSAVEEDVATAGRLAQAIRTYTVHGSSHLIPEFCDKYGVDCIVGAWIGPNRWQNDAQLELMTHLAGGDNPRIKAVIIGNEVLHRGDCTESQLIDYVRRAKAEIDKPIAVADTWTAWIEHPKIAAEVDICGVQIYPYWEGMSIDGAAQYTVRRVREVQKQYPDKRVILTEFGWPTSGESLGQAEASPDNAARYVREILPLLEKNSIEYYYFAVWDEKWKVGPEGGVGAHWGLLQSDGSMKPEFKALLPRDVHAGSDRPPRSIEFRLIADVQQNARLVEIAVGNSDSDSSDRDVAARGAGLEVSSLTVARNRHSGSRLLRLSETQDSTDDGQHRPDNQDAQKQQKTQADSDADQTNGIRGDEVDSPAPAPGSPAPGLRSAVKQTKTATGETPTLDPDRPLKANELYGVCLSLFRDNETPHTGITPLLSELRTDVTYAADLARAVRTYSVTDSFAFVPELCEQTGVDCFPGAAMGKYPWLNELELEMLIRVGRAAIRESKR